MELRGIGLSRCGRVAVAIAAVVTAASDPADAAETILYVYDARGRLVEVERVQPTVTVKTKYTYDRADNRTKKEVTTTP
jgi:hypothetical protein